MIPWRWLGRQDYAQTHRAQIERRQAILEGASEVIWTLEHDPVVTTGRREVGDLDRVRAAGIPIVTTERGGLATWHGPGQLVAYPLVRLEQRGIAVRRFIAALEHAVIGLLTDRGIEATRDARGRGVWVGDAKIASIGIHISRGVSIHGLALNIDNVDDGFSLFDPCGLGVSMTTVNAEGGHGSPASLAPELASRIAWAVDTLTRSDYRRPAEGT